MTDDEIKMLLLPGYDPSRFKQYRTAYTILLGKTPNSCGCAAKMIYTAAKDKAKEKGIIE